MRGDFAKCNFSTTSGATSACSAPRCGTDAGAAKALSDHTVRRKQAKRPPHTTAPDDEVTTIGGVIGRVVAIKDDTFVLETGADRVKIRFTKTAIGSVEKLNMDKAESKTDKK